MDGAARGKPGPAGIGGVLRNDKGRFFAYSLKVWGLGTLTRPRCWQYWRL